MDVGCGPRGSLQWTKGIARVAVCADPLAEKYVFEFGAANHAMHYVTAAMESMPFADETFDAVASFNNLDHVSSMKAGVAEMVRVLKPGGSLLLGVHIHELPTKCEPQSTSWDILSTHVFPLGLSLVTRFEWEFPRQASTLSKQGYKPFDHNDGTSRNGELIAHLVKNKV